MFFPRLRNHAKWMFVFLALVFGFGFVIFGVGSSLPSGLGDILKNGGSSSSQPSVSDAQKAIAKDPKHAQSYIDLSQAYQRNGNIDAAIPPLVTYTKLKPKNQNVLQELAGLYSIQASKAQQVASQANQDYAAASGLSTLQTGSTSQLFQPGALDKTIQDAAATRGQAANTKMNVRVQERCRHVRKAREAGAARLAALVPGRAFRGAGEPEPGGDRRLQAVPEALAERARGAAGEAAHQAAADRRIEQRRRRRVRWRRHADQPLDSRRRSPRHYKQWTSPYAQSSCPMTPT